MVDPVRRYTYTEALPTGPGDVPATMADRIRTTMADRIRPAARRGDKAARRDARADGYVIPHGTRATVEVEAPFDGSPVVVRVHLDIPGTHRRTP